MNISIEALLKIAGQKAQPITITIKRKQFVNIIEPIVEKRLKNRIGSSTASSSLTCKEPVKPSTTAAIIKKGKKRGPYKKRSKATLGKAVVLN